MQHPTPLHPKVKPAKPYADYPLFPHASGQWAKKINGKMYYFGLWDDHQTALDRYLDQKDDLYAGRVPRAKEGLPTLKLLVNRFLAAKEAAVKAGELASVTFGEYHSICLMLVDKFSRDRLLTDFQPADFAKLRNDLAAKVGSVRLSKQIQMVRTVFKFGYDNYLIESPVRFGSEFSRPSAKKLRQERQEKGSKLFDAEELRKILDVASQPMRSMTLLGINCGFGNNDVGMLPMDKVDLDGGWHTFARPKTAIQRRCKLWPETVQALRDWLPRRPKAADPADDGLLFITRQGGSWEYQCNASDMSKKKPNPSVDSPVGKEFSKLLRKHKLKRPGATFYALRHTFETIGGDSKDQVAVDYIMGHSDPSMAAVYRQTVFGHRLEDVANHVRLWLFPELAARQAVPQVQVVGHRAITAVLDADILDAEIISPANPPGGEKRSDR